jgi:hypothetical protein
MHRRGGGYNQAEDYYTNSNGHSIDNLKYFPQVINGQLVANPGVSTSFDRRRRISDAHQQ